MKHDSLQALLAERFAAAIAQVAGLSPGQIDAAVRPAGDPQFGDYQCNAAMALARPLKAKPRDVAQRIKAAVEPQLADIAEPLEIAGPGFINIRLKAEFLARYLGEVPPPPVASAPRGRRSTAQGAVARGNEATDGETPRSRSGLVLLRDRVGLAPVDQPLRVIVDYSSPNIAKEMHVGHLRTTIIGDVFARVLAFEGHEVIRQNHIGDWGTQMGMVILGMWHIFRTSHAIDRVTEAVGDLMALTDQLAGMGKGQSQPRRELLESIRQQWQADLDSDPDGHRFLAFLADFQPELSQLTPAYRFENAVESSPEATEILIHDPKYNKDTALAEMSRRVTMMLQRGHVQDDKPERTAWQKAVAASLNACQGVYGQLGVLLTAEDAYGESKYHERLPDTVTELRGLLKDTSGRRDACGPSAVLVEDHGAQCIFFRSQDGRPQFTNPDGQALPMIIQKSDGAFLYATTDLAAIRYRIRDLAASWIVYVTDARQKQHFQMLFAAARAAGWAGPHVRLDHVTFGSVLGPDRKPLKTRAGGTVKLRALLDEAEKRAFELLEKRGAEAAGRQDEGDERAVVQLAEAEKREIARRVGIAAVKYADLCRDRNADYVFNWDTMLAMQGNTAPYMMYAYARIRSIYRKAAERFGSPDVYAPAVGVAITHPAERALALRLARLREAIDLVAADLTPHTLCTYLYELAAEFMRFYESCPVLAAADEVARLSRMRLCDLTARTLRLGLGLLGIEVIERM